MSHIRQQIRDQFKTDLTGLTTTGANVFQSRVYPLEVADLPGILIYTSSEESKVLEIGAPGSRTISRNLTLTVEAIAQATSNLDQTIDTMSKEIEVAISNSSGLEALCSDWFLTSSEIILTGESKKPSGKLVLNFQCDYINIENDPETAK